MFDWLRPQGKPIIVAHRGSSTLAPENTLAAFRRAVDDGADAVELDVRLTRDGRMVVFHDARLERTTDGYGPVREKTLAELHGLSAGMWFHSRFERERIPTLGEVFDVLPKTVGINIELKVDRGDRRGREDLVDRLQAEIVAHRELGRVLVSSFDHGLVREVKRLMPAVMTGLLFHPLRQFARSPTRAALMAGASYLIFSSPAIRGRVVRAAHDAAQAKLLVAEYTINTRRRLECALRYGVDAVVTDNPVHICYLLSRMQ